MDEREIRRLIGTGEFGRFLYSLDSIDSTNNRAKELAIAGADEGTVVIAEEQTAGRGRLGRRWESPAGLNCTFSVILKPTLPPDQAGIIPLTAGLAVAEAIQSVTGQLSFCKWPNDILIRGLKVCGILCEAVTESGRLHAVVAGIGLNVNQVEFSGELKHLATSLALATGKKQNREQVLAAILARLEHGSALLRQGLTTEVLARFRSHCPMLGKSIRIRQSGQTVEGVAADIAGDGALIVRCGDREETFVAGDITILREGTDP